MDDGFPGLGFGFWVGWLLRRSVGLDWFTLALLFFGVRGWEWGGGARACLDGWLAGCFGEC